MPDEPALERTVMTRVPEVPLAIASVWLSVYNTLFYMVLARTLDNGGECSGKLTFEVM